MSPMMSNVVDEHLRVVVGIVCQNIFKRAVAPRHNLRCLDACVYFKQYLEQRNECRKREDVQ